MTSYHYYHQRVNTFKMLITMVVLAALNSNYLFILKNFPSSPEVCVSRASGYMLLTSKNNGFANVKDFPN